MVGVDHYKPPAKIVLPSWLTWIMCLPHTERLFFSQFKDAIMATNSSRGGSGKGGSSKGVSAARLHQRSGVSNSFGGYTKVNKGNGSFTMKKTSDAK